jgi:Tfp pilus assembly protein FimT
MIVAAIIVLLIAIAVPSLSGLMRSSGDAAVQAALRSLFASARARAATSQQYVGVRFQQNRAGQSYAIMLAQAQAGGHFVNGCPNYQANCTYLTFVAADSVEPVVLPKGMELAQGDLDKNTGDSQFVPFFQDVVPATTFTVVFSPAGQIVRRQVHVTQRSDRYKDVPSNPIHWWDPIFNLRYPDQGLFPPEVIDKGTKPDDDNTDPDPDSMIFAEDPRPRPLGQVDEALEPEISQNSLWIYERQRRLDAGSKPYTGFINPDPGNAAPGGKLVMLNVYTGAPVIAR